VERSENFHIWLGISALLIAGSAGFFSVFGLSKLFSGATLSVIVMASSLELGKLVTAAFVYRYWKLISWFQRIYLSTAVIVLIAITSAGIFGYLSNAYQGATVQFEKESTALLYMEDRLDQLKEDKIFLTEELEVAISELPDNYLTAKRKLREEYQPQISDINKQMLDLKGEVGELKIALVETGVDVGPAIYLARTFNTDVDSVVKFFIFILIFVFDPLAVMLVVAFNQAIVLRGEESELKIGNQKSLLTKKAKNWWEVYGETKDKILKREDIVEPEEDVVEVIKEDKTSDKNIRKSLRGGVRT
jgi:hypothetical protein|tara:strand:- start:108 stop:1019 length:912 start_codon:yes stop_codon:yes gene_type:complete